MVEKFSGPGMLDTDSLLILPFGVYGYSWLILCAYMCVYTRTCFSLLKLLKLF